MHSTAAVSAREARWLAVEAQGLGRARPSSPPGRAVLRRVFSEVGVVQLDAINVVERTQFLVIFRRLGSYDTARLRAMTGAGGELFEYWGHAASLMPMAHYPLFRWRMDQHRTSGHGPAHLARREQWQAANAAYVASVFSQVRDRGPLTAAQLSDPRRRAGEWWERRSLGRVALEWLFDRGDLSAWRSPSFERVYDLPERVIPASILAQAGPSTEDAHRTLITMAARSQGVGTIRDLASYHGLKAAAVKTRVVDLVESGELLAVDVEGWTEPGYLVPGARPAPPSRTDATLLSPFDSLIWDRARTRRLFDFDYRIEVYVPAPDRRYGYYVLPLLVGDRLLGRLDLKADRKGSVLRVHIADVEPGGNPSDTATSAAAELDRLRAWLGLAHITIDRKGNLADPLRRAIRADHTSDRQSRCP